MCEVLRLDMGCLFFDSDGAPPIFIASIFFSGEEGALFLERQPEKGSKWAVLKIHKTYLATRPLDQNGVPTDWRQVNEGRIVEGKIPPVNGNGSAFRELPIPAHAILEGFGSGVSMPILGILKPGESCSFGELCRRLSNGDGSSELRSSS